MLTIAGNSSIVSLNVGKPAEALHGSKPIMTGIFKTPSQAAHQLSVTGLNGDGQADTVHHGGPDKAVCAYFEAHYPFWEERLATALPYGAFGENWTVSGWSENDLCIGDIIQAGEVTVQVSQPRQPCYKLGIRHNRPALTAEVQNTGYTGFYFRVLEEGQVSAGVNLSILERHPSGITIAEANQVMYTAKRDRAALEALLAVDALASSWRETLNARLEKLIQEQAEK
ncbi:MOSC domain-containing protein [Paenibacillus gorillae]|uniref:MOSC domain-containing protein n=1 Tax=Paenibacillus gorillae TaxID=1243662 RepID=UPI0004BA5E3A|nr:MOSC domain-containing protein [Paenibacillus gorillae]